MTKERNSTQISTKHGINTQLAHMGNNPHDCFGFVNPPVVRGSTVLFPDYETMRDRNQKYTYGTHGTPTTEPCGVCDPCMRISEGRFIDVLEIDAASSTGVDSMREINRMAEGKPAAGRYKIFIIDEVHMLSTSAFNAMLKTLEEPRGHTKFILATTEIRKVPVTVLSRCQRFDLRRIEPEDMLSMLRRIAKLEEAEISDDALALITRAAEGSARDAQSLLDQAISHGAGETSAEQVRAMLGLADRGRVLDLMEMILRGDAGGALNELGAQYAAGADPLAVLRDLAEITHWVSVVKIGRASCRERV